MKIRYIVKHLLFRFSRAFYHARKFLAVFGLCLILLLSMFTFGIVASADTVYGITIDENDILDQTVDPDFNEKLKNEYYENQNSVATYSGEDDSAQSEADNLVDSQQNGLVSALTYIDTFADDLLGFQASFFSFIKVFDEFAGIPVISFLICSSVGVGLLAFFLNLLPSLISMSSSRTSGEKVGKKGSG